MNQKVVLLASLYPFISGNIDERVQTASAILKTAILLHGRATIATTIVLRDKNLQGLLRDHEPFLRTGALRLDLRTGVKSFYQASQHNQFDGVDGASGFAMYLDDVCKGYSVHYEPNQTTGMFIGLLREYLNDLLQRSRRASVRTAIALAIDRLESADNRFTLNDACSLVANAYLARSIGSAAKYFYCVVGASAVGANLVIPQKAWSSVVGRTCSTSFDDPEPDYIADADRLVMNWFGLDIDLLDRLSAEEVLTLRSEGLTRQYLDSLLECVKVCHDRILNGNDIRGTVADGRSILQRLQLYIASHCEREKKIRLGLGGLSTVVDEGAGMFVPGFGVMRKAAVWLGNIIARRSGIRLLDRSLTPMTSYVERLRQCNMGRFSK